MKATKIRTTVDDAYHDDGDGHGHYDDGGDDDDDDDDDDESDVWVVVRMAMAWIMMVAVLTVLPTVGLRVCLRGI